MSRTEKPDEESWKTEVEKANRSKGGGATARSAKTGKFVTGNGESGSKALKHGDGGTSPKSSKSEKPKDGKS